MKRSTRVLLLFIIIEAGLAALWWQLLAALRAGDIRPAGDPAATAAAVSSTLGGVMGVVAGVMLVVWLVLRLKGR